MRNVLLVGGIVLATSVLAVGCASSEPPTTAEGADDVQQASSCQQLSGSS